MPFIDHATQPLESWREGVMTRMVVSAAAGSAQLTVFEQECAPGCGAPVHRHAVEEVLTVLEGEAEIRIGDEVRRVGRGDAALIPAGRSHGFVNCGAALLRVQAILAAPIFEAQYEDGRETPRRWNP